MQSDRSTQNDQSKSGLLNDLSDLKNSPMMVGIKQSRRSLDEGKVDRAFVAQDADAHIIHPFMEDCKVMGVEIVAVESMKELGHAAGIDIGAAVVVVLK